MTPTEKIWHNGQFINWDDAKIHVLSHVVSYGSSVFEGIRCYETASGPAVFRLHEHVRRSLFHVVSIATTTGYTMRELASHWFSPLTAQVFFLLMIIGGCIASTAGGFKVQRIAILGRLFRRQLRAATIAHRDSR